MTKKPEYKSEASQAASILAGIVGRMKTPAQQAARRQNAAKAAAARKGQRSGPNCKRCKRPWAECDAQPCR